MRNDMNLVGAITGYPPFHQTMKRKLSEALLKAQHYEQLSIVSPGRSYTIAHSGLGQEPWLNQAKPSGSFKALSPTAKWFERIEYVFAVRERKEVKRFLGESPFLIPLLMEIHTKIQEYFPGTKSVLEVVADPEEKDDVQMVLYIKTDFQPEEALARLHCFDEEWWLDAMDQASNKLCVHLEFS